MGESRHGQAAVRAAGVLYAFPGRISGFQFRWQRAGGREGNALHRLLWNGVADCHQRLSDGASRGEDARPYADFVRSRYLRLAPSLAAVLLVYLLGFLFFPERSKLPDDRVQASLYVAANLLLLPGVFPIEPILTVSWTLSYIMLFAVVLPPAYQLLRMKRWSPWARCGLYVAAMLVAGPSRFHAGSFLLLGALFAELRSDHADRGAGIPARQLYGLLTGFIVASAVCRMAGPGVDSWSVCLLNWAILGTVLLSLLNWEQPPIPEEWKSWIVQTGRRTYSFYLGQGITLNGLFLCLHRPQTGSLTGAAALYFLSLLPTILLAWLLHEGIEKRFASRPADPRENAGTGVRTVAVLHASPSTERSGFRQFS